MQWVKNVFVLLPLFFGGALFQPSLLLRGLLAAMAFSLAASSIYCFNDINDVEYDRRHPVKCRRPIASGEISVGSAYLLMGLLLALALLLVWPLSVATIGVLSLYWLLNMAYCRWLKRHAIVDVCVVAFGFVLRLLAGSLATGIALSRWIVLMTFLLTLFLSLAKRRDDVLRLNATGEAVRASVSRYNLTFINQAITITATVSLVCYIMYTVSPEVMAAMRTDKVYLTTVFVLVGLLRYLQVTVVDERSGDPTRVLMGDRLLQADIACWVLSFLFMIYR